MQRTALVALVAALALAGAGCGGSDGPTRAEFVKQANAVCAKIREGIRTSAGSAEFIDKYAASQRAKAKGIAALSPPDAIRRPYEQYKRVLAARVQLIDKYLPAIKQGKKPPLTAEGVELADREEELIQKLQLVKCDERHER